MRVLIIVPAFNEARSLPHVVEDLKRNAPWADVCIVDDASTDETARVARELGVEVLRLPVNLGIGGAVQTGYQAALWRGYDVAVQFDGDGQHDASSLDELLEPIRSGRADLVVGSRFLTEGGYRSTSSRRLGIRYLSWVTRLRCGATIQDVTSGYRAAARPAIEVFAKHYPADYPEPEAVALASRAGLRVVEVPARMRERVHGASSITLVRSVYYFVKVSLALVLLPARRDPLEATR
jgi:glycosyltransferase involved in cell wall biosynthesis